MGLYDLSTAVWLITLTVDKLTQFWGVRNREWLSWVVGSVSRDRVQLCHGCSPLGAQQGLGSSYACVTPQFLLAHWPRHVGVSLWLLRAHGWLSP